EDAAHRFVAADADGAQRAVAVGDHGHAAVVGLDERGRAGAGRGDERLAAQVLLGVAAPLAADAGNAVGVADPAQAALDAGAVVTRVAAAAAALATVLRHRADGAVLEHDRDRAALHAHARERPDARRRSDSTGAGPDRDADPVGHAGVLS